MAKLDFSQFSYFPFLQCSEAEHMGYRELTEQDKNSIIPVIELSQIKYEASFAQTIDATLELLGERPFILDLSKDRAPAAYVAKNNPDHVKIAKLQAAQDAYNHELTSLLATGNGFENWRLLVAKFPSAVPILQFTDPETQGKAILREAAQFLKSGVEQIALRITQETSEAIYPVIGQISAILDNASQLLLIVDCGQGRQRIAERAEFSKSVVARVTEELGPTQAVNLVAICANDSYTSPQSGVPKVYESLSWELWRQSVETFPFLFGDYAARYRMKKANTFMPGEWLAQVIYPLKESWLVYRHPNAQDASGWIAGSTAVLAHPECDKLNNCWGSSILIKAAAGDINGVSSSRFWNAAKINMHIHRQIQYAQGIMAEVE